MRTADSGIHFYSSNPDGTDVQLLYGRGSHNTLSSNPSGADTCPAAETHSAVREGRARCPTGSVLAMVPAGLPPVPISAAIWSILDVQNSVGCFQRSARRTANTVVAGNNPCPPMSHATTNDVRTIPGPSPGGRFNSAYPLWDGTGRTLVSWEECRLLNPAGVIVPCTDANLAMPNVQIAPPLYSAWLLNPSDNTFKPVVPPTEGIMVTDIVTLQARTPPAYIPPIGTSTLTGDAVGVIDIRSIYDWADAINPQAIARRDQCRRPSRA